MKVVELPDGRPTLKAAAPPARSGQSSSAGHAGVFPTENDRILVLNAVRSEHAEAIELSTGLTGEACTRTSTSLSAGMGSDRSPAGRR
jgi:hypothetical protein